MMTHTGIVMRNRVIVTANQAQYRRSQRNKTERAKPHHRRIILCLF